MSMMYQAYQNHMDLTAPWRTGAAAALKYLNLVPQGVSDRLFGRLAAALELISRSSLTYHRPAYGIDRVMVGNQELEVTEEVAFATPFGSLLHFKKENSPGAAAAVAGGADVRPFRDAVARHREDAAAGPRRLHHRLAQPARHSASCRPLRPRGLHRSPDHLPRQDRPARAHGGDLPAVGVGAGRRRDHVGGQSSGPAGDADPDGGADRHPHPADQGQRLRQEQADQMVRGEPDQLRAGAVQGRVPPGLSRLRAAHRLRVDESRAPHQAAHRSRPSSGQGREGEGRSSSRPSTTNISP